MGWYYGFKLHLLCNERGELLNFALTRANVDDRNPKVFNDLTKDLFGKLAYMTKRDLKSLVLPLFTIVLGKNFSMTKNLLSLRLSSHH